MVMEDVQPRQEQQPETRSQALATRRKQEVAKSYDYLDDTPIYASTGVITKKLGASGKYWLEIREQLDFGEQTILDNASVIGVQREQVEAVANAGQTVRLDLTRQRLLLCALYITRISVPPDRRGNAIKWPRHINERIEVIKHLNPKWGEAIIEIITEHVAALQEEDEAAQADADEAAGLMNDGEEDDSPPSLSQNGSSVVEGQSSLSVSTPVGASAN